MTLTQQNRTRLTGIITDIRDRWDAAGVEAAIKQLDQRHPNDPLLVVALAVAAARDPGALTPAAMLAAEVEPVPVATRIVPSSTARATHEPCPEHGFGFRRPDGELSCCYSDRIAAAVDRSLPARAASRPVGAPPASVKARLDAMQAEAEKRARAEVPGVS